jgi:hypothetical protein
MKTILTIGHSIMGAKNMAKDLIDIRQEKENKRPLRETLFTAESKYIYLAHFQLNDEAMQDFMGMVFDEVYIMGDMKVQDVAVLTKYLKDHGYAAAHTQLNHFEADEIHGSLKM